MPDRAVVAISENRRWLVVLDVGNMFCIYEKDWDAFRMHMTFSAAGQSADDVLSEFLEGRKA